ncbi:hypothetical protein AB6805_18075 [Chitinophaga sp. RCC_12]|uniref:hypothetical protein n=1 Tax=Chitinophaga sp. RCC_12 TaxID=3239226 RepID=UPI00352655AF
MINEYTDKEDRQVKLFKLTASGDKTLKKAKQQVLKVAAMLTQDLTEDDNQF